MGMGMGMGLGMGSKLGGYNLRGGNPNEYPGSGGGGPMMSYEEMETIHSLFYSKNFINRTLTETARGTETRTSSSDEQVANWIKRHVSAMKKKVENKEPVRLMDPVFYALFQHADEIEMRIAEDRDGVTVWTDGTTRCAVALAKAHAKVVTGFINSGFDAMHTTHEVPMECDAAQKEALIELY